jgi:ketosteroid isomerase-like protein
MTTSLRLLPILALAFATHAVAQDAPSPAPPQARMTAAECEVWARELSFAQSVADHDAAAFAEHLHPDAAFGVERAVPTRGRETIASQWAGLIDGKALALRWYPTRTTIGGVGDIAASSGPALYEDLAPGTKQRYSMSRFHSVWHKGDDGIWRVLFDDGTPPQPATEAEAEAFKAGRQTACPRA